MEIIPEPGVTRYVFEVIRYGNNSAADCSEFKVTESNVKVTA